MSRFNWGVRDRLPILPPFIWLNLSKGGASVSFHFWIATWNTRRGWHFRGPWGTYLQESRKAPDVFGIRRRRLGQMFQDGGISPQEARLMAGRGRGRRRNR